MSRRRADIRACLSLAPRKWSTSAQSSCHIRGGAWPKGQACKKCGTYSRASSAQTERARNSGPMGNSNSVRHTSVFVVYLVLSAVWKLPIWVAGLYLLLSAATFIAYAADKSAAARNSWRTPESTLHTLALAGGWPGALLAQQFLRHKSTKKEFRQTFWGTVMLNVVGLVVLASPIIHSLILVP